MSSAHIYLCFVVILGTPHAHGMRNEIAASKLHASREELRNKHGRMRRARMAEAHCLSPTLLPNDHPLPDCYPIGQQEYHDKQKRDQDGPPDLAPWSWGIDHEHETKEFES